MKTFKDLIFKSHPGAIGLQARMDFENGYGISVIRFSGGPFGGSYTDNDQEWECAVFHDGRICYDTPVADDVLGHQTEADVTNVMRQIQELKSE